MSNPQGDDKPASVETCEECGRTTRASLDRDYCSLRGERHCLRLTIAKLRAEVETLRARAKAEQPLRVAQFTVGDRVRIRGSETVRRIGNIIRTTTVELDNGGFCEVHQIEMAPRELTDD